MFSLAAWVLVCLPPLALSGRKSNCAAILAPFVNDDTLGVAYVDVATATSVGESARYCHCCRKVPTLSRSCLGR